ncbi:MAG: arylesterase [Sedimenticolaceae bacterium]|nr:arylesterase [Sedimenticolaceae bacterium]
MSLHKFLFMIVLLALIAPATASDRQVILVLGDSISSAYGIDKEQGWVALLQQRLDSQYPGWHVVNASVSGDTSRTGLKRLAPALDAHRPAILIVELGGNDGLRGLPFPEIRDSLSSIVETATQRNVEVLLAGIRLPPNYGEAYNSIFTGIYSEVAGKYGIPLVPKLMDQVAEKRELMQEDGIHPTAEAQPQLLENVWVELEPMLNSVSQAKAD